MELVTWILPLGEEAQESVVFERYKVCSRPAVWKAVRDVFVPALDPLIDAEGKFAKPLSGVNYFDRSSSIRRGCDFASYFNLGLSQHSEALA